MSYKKGDKLTYKGHKLGELYDSIPGIITYKTNRIENIETEGYFTMITEDQPAGFKTIKVNHNLDLD